MREFVPLYAFSDVYFKAVTEGTQIGGSEGTVWRTGRWVIMGCYYSSDGELEHDSAQNKTVRSRLLERLRENRQKKERIFRLIKAPLENLRQNSGDCVNDKNATNIVGN